MLTILVKSLYIIIAIMLIIIVIPGFVTVIGFAVCIVGHFGFDMTPETTNTITDFIQSVWHLYGIM